MGHVADEHHHWIRAVAAGPVSPDGPTFSPTRGLPDVAVLTNGQLLGFICEGWGFRPTLSSGLREALYWPKNGLRSNLIPPIKISKFFWGSMPLGPPGIHMTNKQQWSWIHGEYLHWLVLRLEVGASLTLNPCRFSPSYLSGTESLGSSYSIILQISQDISCLIINQW